MSIKKFLVFIYFLVVLTGCATKPINIFSDTNRLDKKIDLSKIQKNISSKDYVYKLSSPNQRVENKEKYFSHEVEIIKQRRAFFNIDYDEKNKNIIGLGLSGGGIRANAFGLGILAGLSKFKYKNGDLLNRIDYISSVSGGSWANGAYFIQNLDNKKFFDCLDLTVEGMRSLTCDKYSKVLRYGQFEVVTADRWEDGIKQNSLLNKNIQFSKDNIDDLLIKKPYPIINVTHSAILAENPTEENFPFEITPHYFGTIVDCGSGDEYCSFIERNTVSLVYNNNITGFFVRQKAKDLSIMKQNFFSKKDENGDFFSKYLHVSSAVIGKILSLTYYVRYKDALIENLRDVYVLSDGGKADNIGLTPLVERGANLIIISQISSDPSVEYEDLKISSKQVKKLLKRDVDVKSITKYKKNIKLLTKSSYSFNNQKEGDIIFIKPTLYNVKEFEKYLKTTRDENGKIIYKDIIRELEEDKKPSSIQTITEYLKNMTESVRENKKYGKNEKRFPQTPTFIPKYPKNLIYAYYLLGKFIAEKHLNNEINVWLEKN